MKICRRAVEYLQVWNEDGAVGSCPWAKKGEIGSLSTQTIEDILHSDEMLDWYQSFLDGSFRYCVADECKYMANDKMKDVLIDYSDMPEYPKYFSISYDHTCNYQCTVCCEHRNSSKENFDKIESEILKFINKVEILSANGRGELFASPSVLSLLSMWKPECEHPKVILETNGYMFTRENWKKIENIGKYYVKVAVTIMSFDSDAYKLLSGVSYGPERVIENLHFINELKEKGIINELEIATVYQERNFRTLPEFTRRCLDEFHADIVRLRPFYYSGAQNENIEWFFDVRNAKHPYHKEFLEVMKDPIFDNPKVMHWAGREMPEPKAHPGMRYSTIKQLFMEKDVAQKIEEYFTKRDNDGIIIYGAGVIGKAFATVLESTKISVKSYIDRMSAEKCYRGIPILKPDELSESISSDGMPVVIAMSGDCREVKDSLEQQGYSEIIAIDQLLKEI